MAETATSSSTSVSICLGSRDEIKRVFEKFDRNGDGKISSDELNEILRMLGSTTANTSTDDLEAKHILSEIDKDGDGYIDLDEFTEFIQSSDGDQELREAFDYYDLDKNGLISASELHSVLKKLGEKSTLSDCKKMIRKVDKDGDDNVNFQEFKSMMTGTCSSFSSLHI